MKLKSFLYILFLVLGLNLVAACKSGSKSLSPPLTNDPGSGDDGGDDGSDPEPGEPGSPDDEAGYNVTVDELDFTTYFIHAESGFTDECVVDPDTTVHAERDLTCIVEVNELEGRFHGIPMRVNMPKDMCSYMVYDPYYYFGQDYGNGPTAIEVRFDSSGTYVGGTVTGSNGGATASGVPYCDFTYNSDTNCCRGTYDLTTITNYASVDPEKPQTTTVQSDLEWGGKPGNCVSGIGSTFERAESTGMPLPVIYESSNGVNSSFETGSSLLTGSSVWYANYYTGVTAPAAFKMLDTYTGNPYYEFSCLDDAKELTARIRVRIREWNEVAEFENGSSGDPDTTGLEPNWSTPVNDFLDWDDWGSSFPGID
jgi:hypothetical protein